MNLQWRIAQSLLVLMAVSGTSVCVNASGVPAQSQAQENQGATKIAGKVCNAAGEGIAGATLWLEHDADTAALEVLTGADGKYEFVVADGGRYKLKVMKDGFRDAGVDAIELQAGSSKKVDVILEKEGGKAGGSAGRATDSNGQDGTQGSGKTMEFSDEPNFTVAGVTDWSNAGLHGSDANVRTSETLVKGAAALKAGAGPSTTAPSAPSEADAHRLAGTRRKKWAIR